MVSLHHENFSYNLESVQRGAGGCVMAYMNGITTISKKMLLMAFPDIQKGDNGAKLASLAAKLLGQQLVVPGELCFHFDDTNSRIVSARYEADMLTPLLKLLQDVEEASIVLNSALGIHHWSS
ncbi:hypothetical protein PHMEG_0004336 [Phytophthora megakarya]|uniref:Uncharacterized protein n=1 Tax=Phytophthora megakarya TaxID=4795 RepID=A0A225WU17_9STRA|nr:hypothetical protein PHMEG_0004336 [Phytophthora megakarya]